MRLRYALPAGGAVALALLAPTTAHASSPFGVWARIDKITYEPDAKSATRVKVEGAFALYTGAPGKMYADPVGGYMYFQCKSGDEDMCRLQWADIAAAIGTKECAGWGQLNIVPGTVRTLVTPAATPDSYDLGIGVQRTPFALGTCDALQNFKSTTVDAGTGSSSSSSGSTSSSGATSSSGGATPPPTTSPPKGPPASTSPSSSDDGGCSLSPGGASGSVVLGLGLAAALGLARRRRNRGA